MIKGIGNDIIEIERIRQSLVKKNRFLEKLFTDRERQELLTRKDLDQAVAGRFAAKEAVAKALGTGFRRFGMADIEILKDLNGKPLVYLSEKAKDALEGADTLKILVTISHSRAYAMATAIVMEESS